MAGSSWQNSGLTFDDPTRFVDQEETSSLDALGSDPRSMEWTDEKHRLYITSMEASFVEQLYNSNDSFRFHPRTKHGVDVKTRGQGNHRVSGQIKSLHRPDPQPEAYGNLANARNKHFRVGGKPDVASSSFQHNNFYMHQPMNRAGELRYFCGSGEAYNYLPANCNEEVSDQNFVDNGC